MITLDGSAGEGGGQILRTALALSAVTNTPVRVEQIRAGRARPGLMRQHLRAVESAAAVCGADVVGAELASTTLEFRPGPIEHGGWKIDIGSAGSTTLVLQTLVPILLHAAAPSSLVLSGGTHNPAAPPVPFLDAVYAPLLGRMGATLDLEMERPGFYPAGGGRLHARLTPGRLEPMELMSRGGDVTLSFEAIVSGISASIANRELFVLARELGTDRGAGRIVDVKDPRGPGNAVWARLDFPNGAEVVSAVGEKGVRAEVVARGVVNEVRALLAHDVPVGEHTADQLLLLCALAGGGRYRTVAPSLHTTTNADVIRRFLPVDIRFVDDGATWVVEVGPTG